MDNQKALQKSIFKKDSTKLCRKLFIMQQINEPKHLQSSSGQKVEVGPVTGKVSQDLNPIEHAFYLLLLSADHKLNAVIASKPYATTLTRISY